MDAESIRVFLRRYDTYCLSVKSRTHSFALDETKCLQVALKYFLYPEHTYGAIDLGLLLAADYESLEDTTVREYLNKKATESPDNLSVDTLDALFRKELEVNMDDKNATVRMENLFIQYQSLLRRHGLTWLPKINAKISLKHFLFVIRPQRLSQRLESDLKIAHLSLKYDLKAFIKHAIRLEEASQLLEVVPSGGETSSSKPKKGNSFSLDSN